MKNDTKNKVETKSEINAKIIAIYNKCIETNESMTEIEKLHNILKHYKFALRNVTKNINKAVYNIDYTETSIDESLNLFSTNANISRRCVIIACLKSEKCTENDILKAINDYADVKYRNLIKANKKSISGTINDLRNNKALNFVRNNKDIYTLLK